jgi:recombination protein RecT
MATALAPTQQQDRITPAPGGIRALLQSEAIKKRFAELLHDRAPAFLASLSTAVFCSPHLKNCDPNSIISAAMRAAAFDLPIDPNLAYAHIVPYKGQAQFQMGWRGFVQLAQRTGQYTRMTVNDVHEGEIVSFNRFNDTVVFGDPNPGGKVVGFLAYFRLANGFEKYVYMTVDEVNAWGKKFSKTYSREDSPWKTNFDAMGRKTVVKQALSRWGILSIEMRNAMQYDTAVDEMIAITEDKEQRAKNVNALYPPDDDQPTDAATEIADILAPDAIEFAAGQLGISIADARLRIIGALDEKVLPSQKMSKSAFKAWIENERSR